MPKKSDAQERLNTPSGASAPAAAVTGGAPAPAALLGKRAWPRSFQVISGTAASTRRS